MDSSKTLTYRLRNQQLSESGFKELSQLVSHLGAIQAQDYAGAKWSVGLRLLKGTDQQIEKSIRDKKSLEPGLCEGLYILWPLQMSAGC